MNVTQRTLLRCSCVCLLVLLLSPSPALPLSSAAESFAEFQDKPAAEPAKVEFELLRSLHIAVQVKLNDTGPYRMIFDLGAPLSLVSGRAAAEAGLITKEAAGKPAFFGMRGEKTAKKFQIGELVVENTQVMVIDHPTIKAMSEILGPIDGIVGYPFFARYKFTIDYPAKTMTFTPSDYRPQNVIQQMMSRMFGSRDSKQRLISPAALFGLEVAKPDGDDSPGVLITRVWATSPAARAGLRPGDRLLTLDGRWTDSVNEAFEAASLVRFGNGIKMTVSRDNQSLELDVRPVLGL